MKSFANSETQCASFGDCDYPYAAISVTKKASFRKQIFFFFLFHREIVWQLQMDEFIVEMLFMVKTKPSHWINQQV